MGVLQGRPPPWRRCRSWRRRRPVERPKYQGGEFAQISPVQPSQAENVRGLTSTPERGWTKGQKRWCAWQESNLLPLAPHASAAITKAI